MYHLSSCWNNYSQACSISKFELTEEAEQVCQSCWRIIKTRSYLSFLKKAGIIIPSVWLANFDVFVLLGVQTCCKHLNLRDKPFTVEIRESLTTLIDVTQGFPLYTLILANPNHWGTCWVLYPSTCMPSIPWRGFTISSFPIPPSNNSWY